MDGANAHNGIFMRNASLLIGDTSGASSIPSANTITGNGKAGIFGFIGSATVIRDATISDNGVGLLLSTRSSAEISGSTIQLVFGSALLIDGPRTLPATIVTSNAGLGLNCTGIARAQPSGEHSWPGEFGVHGILTAL